MRFLQLSRLAHLLGLAAALLTVNILSVTAAEALFLSSAGAEGMPRYYLLLALFSVPLAVGYSPLVDRLPKPRLLRYVLVLAAVVALGLRALLLFPATAVLYAVYISFSLLELVIVIQFWVLVGSYFTSVELKRYAPHVAMAMAAGGLAGGGLATVLSEHTSPANVLLLSPFLYALAFAQVLFLERSHREIGSAEDEEGDAGLLESLKVLPQLARRYPLVLSIAGGTFLMVVLQCLAEYQVFSIYVDRYPRQEDLTAFLGTVNAVLSVLEFVAIYLITRPLIRYLGVGGMNWMHPATTMLSFGALTASAALPSALVAAFNYQTLTNAVAEPIETLNYNGVPQRFAGRVRVVTEGLVYPGGIAVAGIFLLAAESVLTPLRLTIAGLCLSAVYVACGYWRGRLYLSSLMTMLRARSVNLDDLGEGFRKLNEIDSDEVHRLLMSNEPEEQSLGLELAARMNPVLFLGTVALLLPRAHPSLRGSLVRLYAAFQQKEIIGHVRALLRSEHDHVRALALEALIVRQDRMSGEELRRLLNDPADEVRALASIAARNARDTDPEIEALAKQERMRRDWDDAVCLTVARTTREANNRELLPLLMQMLSRPGRSIAVGREILDSLCALARASDTHLVATAAEQLGHPDQRMRAAACRLLGVVRSDDARDELANSLSDRELSVRQAAADALAAHGLLALPLAEVNLYSPNPEVVNAAISVLGRIHERLPESVLYRFLQPEHTQAATNLRWLRNIPDAGPFAGLRLIIEDSNRRILQRVLHVVGSLGHAPVVNCIRRILYSPDVRLRANAIEALASLQQRRFVEPLVPLLEFEAAGSIAGFSGPPEASQSSRAVLREMVHASDRWIKLGAAQVLAASNEDVFDELIWDDDPVVRQIAEEAVANPEKASETMSRLLFLKKVPLFGELCLDDLMGIAEALMPEEFLERETVFEEGSLGQKLYIVQQGTISILKDLGNYQKEVARLAAGECFGEMSLVDESPRSATAVALTSCMLLTLDKTRFLTLVSQRPEIALQLCRVLSTRLRLATQQASRGTPSPEVQPAGKVEAVGN